jgi:hypothetical protein
VPEEMDGEGVIFSTTDRIDTVADEGDDDGDAFVAVVVLKRLMLGSSGIGRSNKQ